MTLYTVPIGFASRLTAIRFNRLAWGGVDATRPQGVIAAGMENGELALWDPAKIVAQAEYVFGGNGRGAYELTRSIAIQMLVFLKTKLMKVQFVGSTLTLSQRTCWHQVPPTAR